MDALAIFAGVDGAPDRNRTGTPLAQAADFKSAVSTSFTTGAAH